jgi:hypothetical protein
VRLGAFGEFGATKAEGRQMTIRYQARMHHVGVGGRFAGQRVIVLMTGRDLRVLTPDGDPLRHFKLYQPQP